MHVACLNIATVTPTMHTMYYYSEYMYIRVFCLLEIPQNYNPVEYSFPRLSWPLSRIHVSVRQSSVIPIPFCRRHQFSRWLRIFHFVGLPRRHRQGDRWTSLVRSWKRGYYEPKPKNRHFSQRSASIHESLTMGGGNGQKSAAARERNAKQQGKTEEERRAASLKAAKDAQAHKCQLCLMTFMVNVKPPTLLDHVVKKHPAGTDPASCFSSLQGYDPNAPAPAPVAASTAPPKPKPKAADPFDLLAAGLKFKKGIKK